MQALPYPVTDALLAVCLHINGQTPYHAENHYSEAKLEELGCKTIAEAMSRGMAGHIKYSFVRSEKTQSIVEAYYDEAARCKDKIAVIDDPSVSAADITRVLVAGFIARGLYARLVKKDFKDLPVMICTGGGSKFTPTESIVITSELIANNQHLVRDGRFLIDGREYKVGDTWVTGGSLDVAPMSVVSAKMKPELRSEVGL